MMRLTQLVTAIVIAGITAGCTAPGGGLAPDTIWVNGTVITMEGERVVQAVAVLGDQIVAVGSDAEVRRLAGPETRVVDLDGRTMTPGFYAAHDHFPGSGRVAVTQVDLNSPPIGAIEDMDQLVAALAARAAELPEGQWVSGRGYDDTLLAEQRHPTRVDLDRASTTHPIYISHTSATWVSPTAWRWSWPALPTTRPTRRAVSCARTRTPASRTVSSRRAGAWSVG